MKNIYVKVCMKKGWRVSVKEMGVVTWDRILVVLQDVGDARAHDETEAEAEAQAQSSSENANDGRPLLRHSQWRPALQSIAENSGI